MRSRPLPASDPARTEVSVDRGQRKSETDRVLTQRLAPLGVTFTQSPRAVLGATSGVVLLVGLRFGGLIGVLIAGALLASAWVGVGWLAQQRLERANDRLLPEVALRLARALRSGLPTQRAIEQVADELAGSHRGLAVVEAQLRVGRPIEPTVAAWLVSARGDAEQLLAAGLLIGMTQGGDLASAIDGVGEGLRDDLDLDARRRVLLTQSRMSAGVLVALPLVFAAVASGLQGGVIYSGLAGFALLTAGLVLDMLGIVWMRALMRGLQ